jgi:hypothetical protein
VFGKDVAGGDDPVRLKGSQEVPRRGGAGDGFVESRQGVDLSVLAGQGSGSCLGRNRHRVGTSRFAGGGQGSEACEQGGRDGDLLAVR